MFGSAVVLATVGLTAILGTLPKKAGAFPASDTMTLSCNVLSGSTPQVFSISDTVSLPTSPPDVTVPNPVGVAPGNLQVTFPAAATSLLPSPITATAQNVSLHLDATSNATADGAPSTLVQQADAYSKLTAPVSFSITPGQPATFSVSMTAASFGDALGAGTLYFAPHSGSPNPVTTSPVTDYALQITTDALGTITCTAPPGQPTLASTALTPSATLPLSCNSTAAGVLNGTILATVALTSPPKVATSSPVVVNAGSLQVTVPGSITALAHAPTTVSIQGASLYIDATSNPTVDGAPSTLVQQTQATANLSGPPVSVVFTPGQPASFAVPMTDPSFGNALGAGTVYFASHSGSPYPVTSSPVTDYALQVTTDVLGTITCTAPPGQPTLASTVEAEGDLALANVPANMTVAVTSPNGAIVNYTPPTATDEAGETTAPTVSCDHPSGSTFPVGTTTVTCSASDPDDVNSPVTATFTVSVQDQMNLECLSGLPQPEPITVMATLASPANASAPFSVTPTVQVTVPGAVTQLLGGTAPVTVSVSAAELMIDATSNPTTDGAASPLVQHANAPADLVSAQSYTVTPGSDLTFTLPMKWASFVPTGAGTVYFAPAAGSPYPPSTAGTYAFVLDSSAGNFACSAPSAQPTLTSTVVTDGDLALANVPSNMTAALTGPNGAIVNYTPPTATDETGDTTAPTVSCNHPSASTFPVGTTTVTCSASDSDDTPSTVTASFTVTITDTDLALINMPANMSVAATGTRTAVFYSPPTAADEADTGAPTVSCDRPPGSLFAVGVTTVICSAYDADDAPSTVTASFTVTVNGCPQPPSGNWNGTFVSSKYGSSTVAGTLTFASTAISGDYTVSGSGTVSLNGSSVAVSESGTENCGTWQTTWTYNTGQGLVTINANGQSTDNTDASGTYSTAGNILTCVFSNLLCADSGTWMLSGPDNDLSLYGVMASFAVQARSPAGAVVNYQLPSVFDEDTPLPAVGCDPAPGFTFPLGTTTVNCFTSDSDETSGASASFNVTVSDCSIVPTSGLWSGEYESSATNLGTMAGSLTFTPTATVGDYTISGSGTVSSNSGIVAGTISGTENCGNWQGTWSSLSTGGTLRSNSSVSGDYFSNTDGSGGFWSAQLVDTDLSLTNVPPSLALQPTSPAGAIVTFTPPTAVDESGDASAPTVTCNLPSGSRVAIGNTTVTCTASDPDDTNGPVSASFTVTVGCGSVFGITSLSPLTDATHAKGTRLHWRSVGVPHRTFGERSPEGCRGA
jgi:hypothetical protein